MRRSIPGLLCAIAPATVLIAGLTAARADADEVDGSRTTTPIFLLTRGLATGERLR